MRTLKEIIMLLADALKEILLLTKRPDKEVEALSAINRAILYCTIKGDFPKDLITQTIPVDASLYGATISMSALVRFRRFSYLKPTGRKYYLLPLDADKIFSPTNEVQKNKYNIAGTSLTYTLGELTPSLESSYYSYPITLDKLVNTAHWMLDDMPYAIIDLAAARIFKSIGDDASAKSYEQSGMDLSVSIRRDIAQGE